MSLGLTNRNDGSNLGLDQEVQSLNLQRVKPKTFPRHEFAFIAQIGVIFIVIISSVINLSLNNGNQDVWLVLLSAGVGAVLPAPSLKRSKNLMTSQSDISRMQSTAL